MSDSSDIHRLTIASLALPRVGRKTAIDILAAADHAPTTVDGFQALLDRTIGLQAQAISSAEVVRVFDAAGRSVEDAAEQNIHIFSWSEDTYPERLRGIRDPPAVLFVRGSLESLSSVSALAIVGTRDPTEWGRRAARRIALRCAESGIVVVSGLASGCDTCAHEGSLDGQGMTIAVLAHGVHHVYPSANRSLADRIVANAGALVSEYLPSATPQRHFFAERDRIQSALSQAVLVIETDITGGTMHTVNFARKQGREVACYIHPKKVWSEAKTRGNRKLVDDKVAAAIRTPGDLSALIERLRDGPPSDESHAALIPEGGQQLGLWEDESGGSDPRP